MDAQTPKRRTRRSLMTTPTHTTITFTQKKAEDRQRAQAAARSVILKKHTNTSAAARDFEVNSHQIIRYYVDRWEKDDTADAIKSAAEILLSAPQAQELECLTPKAPTSKT